MLDQLHRHRLIGYVLTFDSCVNFGELDEYSHCFFIRHTLRDLYIQYYTHTHSMYTCVRKYVHTHTYKYNTVHSQYIVFGVVCHAYISLCGVPSTQKYSIALACTCGNKPTRQTPTPCMQLETRRPARIWGLQKRDMHITCVYTYMAWHQFLACTYTLAIHLCITEELS